MNFMMAFMDANLLVEYFTNFAAFSILRGFLYLSSHSYKVFYNCLYRSFVEDNIGCIDRFIPRGCCFTFDFTISVFFSWLLCYFWFHNFRFSFFVLAVLLLILTTSVFPRFLFSIGIHIFRFFRAFFYTFDFTISVFPRLLFLSD